MLSLLFFRKATNEPQNGNKQPLSTSFTPHNRRSTQMKEKLTKSIMFFPKLLPNVVPKQTSLTLKIRNQLFSEKFQVAWFSMSKTSMRTRGKKSPRKKVKSNFIKQNKVSLFLSWKSVFFLRRIFCSCSFVVFGVLWFFPSKLQQTQQKKMVTNLKKNSLTILTFYTF